MNKLTRHLLLAAIMMALGGTAYAGDPPKDAKKEEAKPEEPDLPSKPYPKNAVPKAFQPKAEEKKEAAAKPEAAPVKVAEKPAEKVADKAAEKPAEKPAEKILAKLPATEKHDTGHDKPVVMTAPKKRKVARANAPVAPANAAMQQLAHESARTVAAASPRDAYVAQAGDTLDKVIKKTFPSSPFSMEVMREAFARANPKLMPPAKNLKLRAGQTVQLPDVNVMRMVVMGEGGGPSGLAVSGDVHYDKRNSLYVPASGAPSAVAPVQVVQNQPIAIPPLPVIAASSAAPAPEVTAEEKKKWVRFP